MAPLAHQALAHRAHEALELLDLLELLASDQRPPVGSPQPPKNPPIELGLKFTLGKGQLYARLSAPIPFRYRGIFLVQGAEEVGPLFGQRPHDLTQGMHES